MLTPENKWICLDYFYKNKDRHVDWAGICQELQEIMQPPQRAQDMLSDFKNVYISASWEEQIDLSTGECENGNDNDRLRINAKGISEYEKIKAFRSRAEKREETAEEIQELTKTSLRQIVNEFPTTQWQAKWGFIISVAMVILAVITIIVELNKDETTTVKVLPLIDTSKYRQFYEQTNARLQYDSLSLSRTKSRADSLQMRIDSLESRAKK